MVLCRDDVEKAVKGLLGITENKLDIVNEPERIFLSVTMKMVPAPFDSRAGSLNPKAKIINLNLPFSICHDKQAVCLFVKDIDKNEREYETTKQHYVALLKGAGLGEIPDIIPLKQVFLEYKPYEAKRDLCKMYDVFLSDKRISRILPSVLGKNFYGRKAKIPKLVNMSAEFLKDEINSVINRIDYIMSMRGSSSMVPVANSKMQCKDIVANIIAASDQIAEGIPGGKVNLRNIYMRTTTSPAIPLYVSLSSTNDAEVSTHLKVEETVDEPEDITTLDDDRKVRITKDGDVLIYDKNGKRMSKAETLKLLSLLDDDSKSKKRKGSVRENKVDEKDTISRKKKKQR